MIALLLALLFQQNPQTDAARLVALQLSKECRDTGDKFWTRGGYRRSTEDGQWDYLTHYNREQSKCFIRLRSTTTQKDGARTLFFEIYDAVDGVPIGSHFLLWDGKDDVSRFINDNGANTAATPPRILWFEDLMRH